MNGLKIIKSSCVGVKSYNSLFSGVLVCVIDDFLCVLKTLIKERGAEMHSWEGKKKKSNVTKNYKNLPGTNLDD